MATQLSFQSQSLLEEQEGSLQQERCRLISQRLLSLECPYLEGLDESVVKEIIFSAGEARIRILQWLIGRAHPQLKELLITIATTTIPRLTSMLADLGLCRREDYELIQGTTSMSKQVSFLEALLTLVEEGSCKELDDTLTETNSTPTPVKMEHCCRFLDGLCQRESLSEIFPSSVSLLSPAIAKSISTDTGSRAPFATFHNQSSSDKKKTKSKTSSVPSQSHLTKHVNELEQLLEEKRMELEQLEQKHPSYKDIDHAALDTYHKNLTVSLNTLSQLMESFSHMYEADFQPWTNNSQPAPQPSQIGPLCKRIDLHQQYLFQLFESLKLLESNRQRIEKMAQMAGDSLANFNSSDKLETLEKHLDICMSGQESCS